MHQLRGRVDGILVGKGTVAADNPLLTARPAGPRQAARVVADSHGWLPNDTQLVQTARQIPVLVALGPDAPVENRQRLTDAGCELVDCAGSDYVVRIQSLLDELGRRPMTNLLVEGGSALLGSLFDAGAVDEVHVFVAPRLIGGNRAAAPIGGDGIVEVASSLQLHKPVIAQTGTDVYIHGRVAKSVIGVHAVTGDLLLATRSCARKNSSWFSLSVSPPAVAAMSRITVPQFSALKAEGRRISMLTAYDFAMAELLDSTGIEGILVGDSMSMVVQGHASTLPVTLDEIIYHAEMVGRAVKHALLVVDMPFPSSHLGLHKAIENAGRILKETRCQAVKLEGGVEQAEVIAGLVSAGIPVMGHVGLRPQSVHQLGGYKVQRDEKKLLADAQAADRAGAFAIVLECIPERLATKVTQSVRIPTIGIGAGNGCDGQILVVNDLLGLTPGKVPRFVKAYADLRTSITEAVTRYRDDVRAGTYPGDEHTFK